MELNLQAQQGRILKLAPEDRPQALKAHPCSNMSRQAFLSSFGPRGNDLTLEPIEMRWLKFLARSVFYTSNPWWPKDSERKRCISGKGQQLCCSKIHVQQAHIGKLVYTTGGISWWLKSVVSVWSTNEKKISSFRVAIIWITPLSGRIGFMTNTLHLGRFSFGVPPILQANSFTCVLCFWGCFCLPFIPALAIDHIFTIICILIVYTSF